MSIVFEFKKDKAVAAVHYIAHEIQEISFEMLYSILYNADKIHLERYGRFIFGETYGATLNQVIPLNVVGLFLVKDNALSIESGHVITRGKPDIDELSESDIKCLDKCICDYYINRDRLRNLGEEWIKARERAKGQRLEDILVEDIVAMFPDSQDLLDYLKGIDKIERIWE